MPQRSENSRFIPGRLGHRRSHERGFRGRIMCLHEYGDRPRIKESGKEDSVLCDRFQHPWYLTHWLKLDQSWKFFFEQYLHLRKIPYRSSQRLRLEDAEPARNPRRAKFWESTKSNSRGCLIDWRHKNLNVPTWLKPNTDARIFIRVQKFNVQISLFKLQLSTVAFRPPPLQRTTASIIFHSD